ncbi:hypothetical protein Salat_2611400 [Sesamum alatum]|uniref:Uncharacterized protein n=1 Tax=Sesamum alatum TaxID=300844 RepID=A0AAE1XND2_9LAMI|nr:hypothetical protein Salat_2611400 [Sesamum alatum]
MGNGANPNRYPSYRTKLINSSKHTTWLQNWEEQSLVVNTHDDKKHAACHEPDSISDRTNQHHRSTNTTIYNSDSGSAITEHTTKPDQPVLSNSSKHEDNTTPSACFRPDNNRITDEEFPLGFEPGFKFQSSNVTNTCSKPKRQRGRPKLTRQSLSKEQLDQTGTHSTTTVLQCTQESLFWRRMQQRTASCP